MTIRPNALLLAAGLAFASAAVPTAAHAQVAVNVQLGHPTWGPAVPVGTQYYYVPEIDGYYDLQTQDYIVLRDGRWARYRSLPDYDPRSFHPVAVDYRGSQPWDRHQDYHARYYKPAPGPGRGPARGREHDEHGRSRR